MISLKNSFNLPHIKFLNSCNGNLIMFRSCSVLLPLGGSVLLEVCPRCWVHIPTTKGNRSPCRLVMLLDPSVQQGQKTRVRNGCLTPFICGGQEKVESKCRRRQVHCFSLTNGWPAVRNKIIYSVLVMVMATR